MGSGFDLFGGGFTEVHTGTVEPTNPNLYDFWVKADIDIDKVVFKNEYDNSINNTLSILTWDNPDTNFHKFYINVSTSDEVDAFSYITSAKYWNGSEWEYPEVNFWDGENWVYLSGGERPFYVSNGGLLELISPNGDLLGTLVDTSRGFMKILVTPSSIYSSNTYDYIRKYSKEGVQIYSKYLDSQVINFAVDMNDNVYGHRSYAGNSAYLFKIESSGNIEYQDLVVAGTTSVTTD